MLAITRQGVLQMPQRIHHWVQRRMREPLLPMDQPLPPPDIRGILKDIINPVMVDRVKKEFKEYADAYLNVVFTRLSQQITDRTLTAAQQKAMVASMLPEDLYVAYPLNDPPNWEILRRGFADYMGRLQEHLQTSETRIKRVRNAWYKDSLVPFYRDLQLTEPITAEKFFDAVSDYLFEPFEQFQADIRRLPRDLMDFPDLPKVTQKRTRYAALLAYA